MNVCVGFVVLPLKLHFKLKIHVETFLCLLVGGGSAGCHTLYHLAKRGVKTILLERCQLTAGTTWHTSGLLWRLRPSDVDIQ